MADTTLYQLLNTAMGDIQRLKTLVSGGPSNDVVENFDRLIATLMSMRDIAGQIAELPEIEMPTWIAMTLLMDSVNQEIRRLTTYDVMSATAGV